MGEVNPRDVLKLYRAQSPLGVCEDTEKFLLMPVSERMELLFYMIQHINLAMKHADGSETISLEQAERKIRGGDA